MFHLDFEIMSIEVGTVLHSFLPSCSVSSLISSGALKDIEQMSFKHRNKMQTVAIALLSWIRCWVNQQQTSQDVVSKTKVLSLQLKTFFVLFSCFSSHTLIYGTNRQQTECNGTLDLPFQKVTMSMTLKLHFNLITKLVYLCIKCSTLSASL